MNELLADLSLIGDEDEGLIFDSTNFDHPTEGQNLILVGCLLTDRDVNFKAMKNRLADLWRPVRGVQISEIGDNRLLFQFFHQMDLERILEGGPWTFDNQFIILHHLQEGQLPMHVPLYSLNFWVQIYGLPIGYFSESIGKQFGAFLGTLLEYDDTNNSGAWRTYMRIRVAINVRQSLNRCKKIKKAGGDWIIVQFKYDKMGSFCFVSGCLGHTERFCETLYSSPYKDMKREWGTWLRAPDRRLSNMQHSKWLRETNHMITTPSSHGHGEHVNDDRRTTVEENLSSYQNPVFSGIPSTQSGEHILGNAQNCRMILKEMSNQEKIPNQEIIHEEDQGLELNEDRKRSREAQVDKGQNMNMELDPKTPNALTHLKNIEYVPNTTEGHALFPGETFLLEGPRLGPADNHDSFILELQGLGSSPCNSGAT